MSSSRVTSCASKLEGTELNQYQEADKYWSSVDATIDGMLGGFAAISPADLQDSKKLLQMIYKVVKKPTQFCEKGKITTFDIFHRSEKTVQERREDSTAVPESDASPAIC